MADQRRVQIEPVRRPQRKLVIAGVAAVLMLAVIIVIATRRTTGGARDQHDLAKRERDASTTPDQAASLLALGHTQFAEGKVERALASYERALRAAPVLSSNAELRANLAKVLDGKDVLASIVALDLLASLTPPADEQIVTYASGGKLEVARHRAVMLAERDGLEAKIDRAQSWMLDLQQASSCDERKAAIEQLAQTQDRRALAALKRARAMKCVEQEAATAIARIEAEAK
jgi:hypothetical protein